MKRIFQLFLCIIICNATNAQWAQRGADIDGETAGDWSGNSVTLSANGSVLAVGALLNSGGGSSAGHVRVYSWNGLTWTQRGSDIDGEAANDQSGQSVSLSSDGSVIAIGAFSNDGTALDAGHVRVYSWNGATWTQRGADIDGEAGSDASGRSVSLSSDGTVLAIGADGNGSSGHVRVYSWNGATWTQRGTDIDGEAANDDSGYSVSLSSDGSVVAIGAYRNDGTGIDAGHVRVYSWNGATWTQRGSDIDGEAADDLFGWSVSLSSDGSVLASGAQQNDGNGSDSGHTRVYSWNGATWTQRGTDIDGEAAGDAGGWSVSLSASGSIVAIGAPVNTGVRGHVRVYGWNGATWSQVDADIDGETALDASGYAVHLSSSGGIVAIGAIRNDGGGSDAGHVRVYENVTILSVDLLSWTIHEEQSGANIRWTASGENIGDYYKLLRTDELGNQETLARFESTGNNPSSYEALDDELLAGEYYYTLQQYNSNHHLEVEETKYYKHQRTSEISIDMIQNNVYRISSPSPIKGYTVYSINGQVLVEGSSTDEKIIDINLNNIVGHPAFYYIQIRTILNSETYTLFLKQQ